MDSIVEHVFSAMDNAIKTIGSELIFSRIYDYIEFGSIKDELFRHLVIFRIIFPLSKFKTVEYLTNAKLKNKEIIENYRNLCHIERAFRMSITDLINRPIYHRFRDRIETHICISFTAYCIYKELERILKQEKAELTVKKAAELTQNMYQVTFHFQNQSTLKRSF